MPILRRSERKTKGIPPERYSDACRELQLDSMPPNTIINHNSGAVSKKTESSSSKRRMLEIELEEARQLAEIEKRKAEIDAELIRREAQLKRELIQEGSSKKSTISGADNIIDLDQIDFQEKIANWKIEDTGINTDLPSINNFITMTADNFNQICDVFKQNSKSRSYERTDHVKTNLPYFDGNPEDWPLFFNQFERSTNLFNICDDENIIRLQKCLKGRARDAVQPLLIAPENVSKIIETLKITFGRPEFIISNLIEKVRRAAPPKEGRFETYLPFSNVIDNLVTTMELFRNTGHMTNPSVLNEIVMKLPPFLRLKWAEESTLEETTTLKTFSVWMRKIALAASSCADFNNYSFSEKRFDHDKSHNKKNINVFSTKKYDKCPNCQKSHILTDCQNFKKLDIDEKWKFVTSKKLCFYCLKPSHNIYSCRVKQKCGIENCQKFHNNILHNLDNHKKINEVSMSNVSLPNKDNDQDRIVEKINFFQEDNPTILLRIIPVKLRGPKKEISTYALLDEAATTTMIDSKVAQEIGLDGPVEPLCYQWLNNVTKNEENSKRVTLELSGIEENSKMYKINEARTVSGLSLPRQTVDVKNMSKKYPYIKKTPIFSFYDAQPTILIGQDQCALTIARKIYQSNWDAPFVSKTLLGWVVHGRYPQGKTLEKSLIYHVCCKSQEEIDEDIHKLVKDSFRIENFGIKCVEENGRSKDDDRALKIMENTIRRVGNHFEIGLLWRNENVTLPDSKPVALNRLKCMERKMDKNKDFATDYCRKIEEYAQKGYIRKLSATEAEKEYPRSWYLPHFGVVNPNKPGKLRLVFDAAAKSNGTSLNDQLLQGPDLLKNLIAIIWKFRQKPIAFCADIKEMFHQVRIRDEDCSAQRFFWRGMNRSRSPDIYEMKAMTFGATSSPCMAQFVKNRNAEEHYDIFPAAARAIVEKHYVDDYLDSTETEEEAITLISEVIKIHKKAGFDICNWISNRKKVIDKIPENLRSKNQENVNSFLQQSTERVLGLWWNPETDNIIFSLNKANVDSKILQKKKIPTKREVLKLVMSVFDPLGFLSPMVVTFKIFLQELWKRRVSWDDEISEDMNTKWLQLLENLNSINKISVPRCYGSHLFASKEVELHGFCDSSEKAFSAVVYLRFSRGRKVYTSFVSAKTRVAPIKQITIPRLELQAAVMLSRLINSVKENLEINISTIYLWTDSRIVLHWIRSQTKRYKTFVAVRVGEITEITDVSNWHWVSGEDNVADESTREVNQANESQWLTGPTFLKFPKSEWPKETNETIEELEQEMKTETILITTIIDHYLPNIERFSKYERLIRATAWMLRFINNCKKMKINMNLEYSEIEKAEEIYIKYVQSECFHPEISDLRNKKDISKSSRLYTLTPLLDHNGVLRIGGRLEQSKDLTYFQKHPAILDQKHRLTKLLIEYYHVKLNHQGQELIINELRQKFWILRMRSAVRKCKLECLLCKKRKVQPQVPEMGQLPECRLQSFIRPFTITGMDYFGPIVVTIGRRHEKRYVVLFTCMSIRAIHLEIAHSLDTDSAVMAIRRFVSRRGSPKEIYSDNGTNLRSADRELRDAVKNLDTIKISEYLCSKAITWRFIPPSSPHMGGSWERLVRSVKDVLKVILKERHPKEEVLQTLIAEAENMVNSRPLTYVSSDALDPESLTPNHFLLHCSNGAAPPLGESHISDENARKQWRVSQALADMFWRRWQKEYLVNLNKNTRWYSKKVNIALDDIVIVVDDTLPRNMWPIGKIQRVYEGKDGKIRVVEVKTQSGIYKRPVAKICKLFGKNEKSF